MMGVMLSGFGAGSACAAGPGVTGDLAKFQGRWVTHAGERGKLVVTVAFEGTQATVDVVTPQGLKVRVKGEVRIDDSVSPHRLDWVNFNGADSIDLTEIPAIYEWKGDALRVCNGGPNNARPTEFKRGDGVLADVHVFERVKGR